MSLNSCRIINLEELRKHIADISVHAATCQSCIDKAYTQGEAIMLVEEQIDSLLFSLHNARGLALKLYSLHHLRSIAKVHGITGNVT